MDALGAGQLEYPDRPKKQRSYGINGLLEDIDTQLLARNERRLAERTESLRESPVAAGNELGAVATGLSSAAMGLAAPVIRTFSSEIADDAQMQSAALQAAQQQNVQEEDYGAVRGFVNRNLPGAVNSVSQAAGLAAAGGMPGLMAGFGAGTFDRSFYEGRQNLLDVPDAAGFGVRDAVLETAPMAVFQGLSKFVPAAAGLEGLFLKPMNQKGVRDIVKTAIIGMGSELTEESITAVGQALNRASSIPGAEDAANWTGEDGTFASSPMAEQLKQVAEQTAITMGLGKVIQQLNPAERAQTIEFVDRQSRRGFEKMSSLVKDPLRKVFKGDRKKAAEVLAPLVTDQERADFGGLPTEAQVVGDEPVTEVPQGVADEEAVPQPGQAATAAPPQEAVDPTVDPVVTQVPGEATTEVLTPTGDVEETGLEPESATDITGRRNEVVEATVADAQRVADDFNQPVMVVETPDNQIVVVPADSVPEDVTVIQAVTPREPTQPTLDPQAPSLAPAEATSSPAPAPVLEPQSESVDDSGFIDDQVEQDLEARPSAEPVMGMAPMSIEEMQEQKNNLLLTAEENEGGELDDDARSRIEMLDQMIWDAEQAQ